MWATQALYKFVDSLPPDSLVLDIGAGQGDHAEIMREVGLRVNTLDAHHSADIQDTWPPTRAMPSGLYDGVWASHVLEHSPEPIEFLREMLVVCKPGGTLCVTVPPAKPQMVGGHINHYGHIGLLLYQACYAGWDLCEAAWGTYGYNLSLLCPARARPQVPLVQDSGDIRTLQPWLPQGCNETAIWPQERGWN